MSSSKDKQQQQQQKKGSEFLCKVRYKNQLPELPFAPKLLQVPQNTNYGEFKLTEWMKKVPYPLALPLDLGIPLDFVNLKEPPISHEDIEEEDLFLLEEFTKVKKQTRHRPMVPWLRRTEYISHEGSKMVKNRKGESLETKRLKQRLKETPIFYKDKQSQIDAIEKGFEFVVNTPVSEIIHPEKENLSVVEVLPVFPDLELWPSNYTHCLFDDDPASKIKDKEEAKVKKNKAIMKPMQNPNDLTDHFMVYLLPSSFGKDKMDIDEHDNLFEEDDEEDQEAETFESFRHYNFSFSKENPMEKLIMVVQEDAVYYNPVSVRFVLQKRREKKKQVGFGRQENEFNVLNKILLSRRDLTEEERNNRKEFVRAAFGQEQVSN